MTQHRPLQIAKAFGFVCLVMAAAEPAHATVAFIVYFGEGPAELSADSLDVIRSAVGFHQIACPDAPIILNAGTDSVATPEENLERSVEYGLLVAQQLEADGVSAKLISINAHGERYPAVQPEDQGAEPRNRRVELDLGENGSCYGP